MAAGRFDIQSFTELSDAPAHQVDPGVEIRLRERAYTPPEIKRMLDWTGLKVEGVYGGTAGNWGLRPPELDEIELMVIAEKPAAAAE